MIDLQSLFNAARPYAPLPLKPGVYDGDDARLRKAGVKVHAPDGGVEIRCGRRGVRIMPEAVDTSFEGLLIRGAQEYNLFVGAHGFQSHTCRYSGAGKTNLLKAAGVEHLWLNKSTFDSARDTFDPGKGGHGAYLAGGGNDLCVEECDFLDCAAIGLHLNACPKTSQGVYVARNLFRGNKSAAVQCSGIWGATFEANALQDNKRDIVIHQDLRRKQCLNADVDFRKQRGRLHLDSPLPDPELIGSSMVIIPRGS